MVHDVFISYSSADKAAADAICAGVEGHGIRAWIAPRDIVPGMNWGGSIIRAITEAKALVLVFSNHTNASAQVIREVERAVSKRRPVVLFRLQDIAPTADLEYFISASHWLDATTPPLEPHVQALAQQLAVLLREISEGPAANPGADGVPATPERHLAGPSEHDAVVARRLTALAEGQFAEGDPALAQESARKALALNPDDPDAHFVLATALLYEGESVLEAVHEYRESTRLQPNYYLGHLSAALLLRELCDFDAAMVEAESALRADPASSEARGLMDALRGEMKSKEPPRVRAMPGPGNGSP